MVKRVIMREYKANKGGRPRLPEHLKRKRVTVSIRAELAPEFKVAMKKAARAMEKKNSA